MSLLAGRSFGTCGKLGQLGTSQQFDAARHRAAGGYSYSADMSILMHRLYRCPNTGLRVQSYACIRTSDGAYEVVTCTICRGVHLIDPATGRAFDEDNNANVSEAAM
jgi:hypothetical protein